ncbi:oxidoreductase [Paracoccus pantotrophus]|uniref:oxidoreductase n=1 Tax=Paracoccus pantotrophus TaxID=82367 RepID=UPI00048AF50E|nr:oxidoreductase [Paracoccus pantotrophus]
MSTWLITGCSSGLGRQLALAVLKHGHNAAVTARDPKTVAEIVEAFPETALALPLDVRNRDQVAEAVRQTEARFGAIDVLVNNAGHGYRAAVEEAKEAEVRDLFDTNFFGAVAMIQAVLPRMRTRRAGAIVNVSSIAGRGAAPGSAFYAATKFALEGMSDALRKEMKPLGIKVIVIEPGAFRTDFAGRSLLQTQANISDYAQTAGQRRKENDHSHGTQQGDPARGAEAIIRVVEAPKSPFRFAMGSDAVAFVGGELDAQRRELDEWTELSVTTDFPT